MTPRERILAAFDHREADRRPAGPGGHAVQQHPRRGVWAAAAGPGPASGGHHHRRHHPGAAHVAEDVLARFGADAALVATGSPTGYRREVVIEDGWERFVDEWGVVRARPVGGLYFESSTAPLVGGIGSSDVSAFAWRIRRDPGRVAGMAERAATSATSRVAPSWSAPSAPA